MGFSGSVNGTTKNPGFLDFGFCQCNWAYNEDLGTMKITLLYHVSCYIRLKRQRNIKSWDQPKYLVITGFCYIRPLYNEASLYEIQGYKMDSKILPNYKKKCSQHVFLSDQFLLGCHKMPEICSVESHLQSRSLFCDIFTRS